MQSKINAAGIDTWRQLQKSFVLQILDQNWKEHLLTLDHLRQGINLRAIAQRDPLNEYKAEAFQHFEVLLDKLRESVTQTLSLVEINTDPKVMKELEDQAREEFEMQMNEGRMDPAMMGTPHNVTQPAQVLNNAPKIQPFPKEIEFDAKDQTTWGKTPRNAPCPCGSGKKFKHCHGKVV